MGTTAPVWVLLFGPGEAPRSDVGLKEAKQASIWSRRIDKVASVVSIRVPSVVASHLRIVRAGAAGTGSPLCLAEVEMYEEVHSPVYEYTGSSPLPENVAASPLSPLEPLTSGFQDTWPAGRWLLGITDRHKTTPVLANNGGGSLEPGAEPPEIELGKQGGLGGLAASAALKHGRGGVSRWELRLTDVLGQTNTYDMDSQMVVQVRGGGRGGQSLCPLKSRPNSEFLPPAPGSTPPHPPSHVTPSSNTCAHDTHPTS